MSTPLNVDLSQFLSEYLSRGFGLMPKREVDIRIFSELYDQGYFGKEPTTHKISLSLQISESKVRSLLYEMDLRRIHDDPDAWLRSKLLHRDTTVSYDPAEGIKIWAADRLMRSAIEERVVSLKGVPQLSTDKRVLILDKKTFGKFVESILTKEQSKQLRDGMVKVKKFSPSPELSIGTVIEKFIEVGIGKGVDQLPDVFFGEGLDKISKITSELQEIFLG